MRWYHYVSYFFGGAFLVNFVPHFINGVTGHRFPTPFASPPGQGESPALINVLWGLFNLVIAYLLLGRVGQFSIRRTPQLLIAAAGGILMAIMLSQAFGRIYGGL
jgi:hypothetical protein